MEKYEISINISQARRKAEAAAAQAETTRVEDLASAVRLLAAASLCCSWVQKYWKSAYLDPLAFGTVPFCEGSVQIIVPVEALDPSSFLVALQQIQLSLQSFG